MSMDGYGLGVFWMTGMGVRVVVFRIRIFGIVTMLVHGFHPHL